MTRPSLAAYRKSLAIQAADLQRPTAQEIHDFLNNPQLVAPERFQAVKAYIEANYIDAHPPPS